MKNGTKSEDTHMHAISAKANCILIMPTEFQKRINMPVFFDLYEYL